MFYYKKKKRTGKCSTTNSLETVHCSNGKTKNFDIIVIIVTIWQTREPSWENGSVNNLTIVHNKRFFSDYFNDSLCQSSEKLCLKYRYEKKKKKIKIPLKEIDNIRYKWSHKKVSWSGISLEIADLMQWISYNTSLVSIDNIVGITDKIVLEIIIYLLIVIACCGVTHKYSVYGKTMGFRR